MKEIPGYKGYYAAEDGHIYSNRSGELIELSQRMHKGYKRVSIKENIKNKQKAMNVHTLVLLTYCGELKYPNTLCRHLDSNPLNNNISNLKWGTVKENIRDSIEHGTAVCLRTGEQFAAAKLTEEQVVEIERLAKQGIEHKDIAKMFNISKSNVSSIKLHVTWKYLWEQKVS